MNQSFSKIWIPAALLIFLVGGILAWQSWRPSTSPSSLELMNIECPREKFDSYYQFKKCREERWNIFPPSSKTLELLCKHTENLVVKKILELRFNQGLAEETLVSCGYNEIVGGAGSDFPLYIIDNISQTIIWKENPSGEGELGGPEIYDVDRDDLDEIIWWTHGCITGAGCGGSLNLYSPKYRETFWTSKFEEKNIQFSSNLEQEKYQVFKDYLKIKNY